MPRYLLSIDQGTTSSRAIIFNEYGQKVSLHQIEFSQSYPKPGFVEHNPEEIWETVLTCCQMALQKANLSAKEILALGISNQRETTVIWERSSGKAIYPAIVWQDRRTAEFCQQLSQDSAVTTMVTEKTGLLIDPYFSATKIHWILAHVPGARARALRGELAFGTIDTFLIWRLTGGEMHATDATNASRTLLFNIENQTWDEDLLAQFSVPKQLLPVVKDSADHFGITKSHWLGHGIPITGVAGDQQAATVGQTCFSEGMIKSTYGTGCFVLLNTGKTRVYSKNRLLSTVAYRIHQEVTYGLEGSIFVAGAAVQWLRDAVRLIQNAKDTEEIALKVADNGGVYLVPAFTGLGAPYWDPEARGAIFGLTRDSEVEHIVRAALESVCYQTQDLMLAMQQDYQKSLHTLRVDGGMAANNWLMQFLADILALPTERPTCIETSALGAAFLAGLGVGLYPDLASLTKTWQLDRAFSPTMPLPKRDQLYLGWKQAVGKLLA